MGYVSPARALVTAAGFTARHGRGAWRAAKTMTVPAQGQAGRLARGAAVDAPPVTAQERDGSLPCGRAAVSHQVAGVGGYHRLPGAIHPALGGDHAEAGKRIVWPAVR